MTSFFDDPMPVFTLKAKDKLALDVIRAYQVACDDEGLDAQADEVGKAIAEFEAWQGRNPGRLQLPDHSHVPVDGDHG